MKIFTRILLALGILFSLMRVEAQVTIGTGTSVQNDPFNYYFGYGRDATIYTAVEMNTIVTGGTITTISWYSNLTTGWVTGPTVIYLKEVGSTTAVPLDTWANTISGATSVYTGTPTWANGWNSIDITDLSIAAGQNLMVLVECNFGGTGTGASGGNAYRYTSSGSNTHGYWQQDNTAPTGNPTRDALRPNVILGGLTPPVPPANDNCAGASSISVSPSGACSYTGISTLYATQTATPVPSCTSTGNDDDIWYSFTSTTAGIYTFRYNSLTALTGTASTVGMDVYTGTCAALSAVSGACSSGFGSSGSGTRTLTLAASTTYYLRLWVGSSPNSGTFNLCVEAPAAPPANNECAGATSLSVSPTPTCATLLTGQTTAGATQSQVSCSGTADEDVWYSFVATSTSHTVTLSNVSGSVTMVTQVFSGVCASLVSIVCGTTYTTTATGLTIGDTYYVRTHTSASGTNATFDICVTTPPPPPANDNCAGALSVPVNPDLTCTSVTAGNTAGATQSQAGCTGTADDDVWFSFVATATSHPVEILNVSGSTDIVHQIFSGTCGSLVSLACTDSPNSTTVTGLTIGNTYYIRVYSWSNATAATTFDVCVKTLPPPPTNDACAGATVIADGSTVTQDVTTATADTAPTCNSISLSTQGVWFKYTAAANTSGTVTIAGCNSTYDMRIRVYTGTCAALTCLAGAAGGDDNDDCAGPGSGLAETHTFPVAAPALHGGGGGAEAPVDYFVLITGAGGTLDFSISALLPLELKSFTGKTMDKTNMLIWETAQERDVNAHIVERSADGATWTEIGRKAGQVQSNVATKYELEDRAPIAKAYYRLRSIDFDGKEQVSNTIVLTRKSELFAITNVFPNPTDARVTVQFASKNEAPVTIRIVDLTGRLVLEQQTEVSAGINEIPVNMQTLATGVYNVTITNGAETAGPVRIVKQ